MGHETNQVTTEVDQGNNSVSQTENIVEYKDNVKEFSMLRVIRFPILMSLLTMKSRLAITPKKYGLDFQIQVLTSFALLNLTRITYLLVASKFLLSIRTYMNEFGIDVVILLGMKVRSVFVDKR